MLLLFAFRGSLRHSSPSSACGDFERTGGGGGSGWRGRGVGKRERGRQGGYILRWGEEENEQRGEDTETTKKPCVREKRAQKPPFCRDSDIATAFQLLSLPAYCRKKECEKCKKGGGGEKEKISLCSKNRSRWLKIVLFLASFFFFEPLCSAAIAESPRNSGGGWESSGTFFGLPSLFPIHPLIRSYDRTPRVG